MEKQKAYKLTFLNFLNKLQIIKFESVTCELVSQCSVVFKAPGKDFKTPKPLKKEEEYFDD